MRNHLEQSVTVLRGKIGAVGKRNSKDNKRILKENVQLLQEINHLR